MSFPSQTKVVAARFRAAKLNSKTSVLVLALAVMSGLLVPSVGTAAPETPGFVTTVAGGGGSQADGIPATFASIALRAIAVDVAGNVFIADGYPVSRVRIVDVGGIITTIAGPGTAGETGDGGPATNAFLGVVRGLAVDSSGNLFIASWSDHRVRKVDLNGVITTVAGDGNAGYLGDGGLGTDARLNQPYRVAVDSNDNLYIGDYANNRIRKVDPDGLITTVAGNGLSSDICRVDTAPCGDGGPATEARIGAGGIALDLLGNLYISDAGIRRIRMVDATGTIRTIAGNGGYAEHYCAQWSGPAVALPLYAPLGLSTDSAGALYIAEGGGVGCVKKLVGGSIFTIAGYGRECPPNNTCIIGSAPTEDGGPGIYTTLRYPDEVAVTRAGDVLFEDGGSRVRKIAGVASPGLH